MREELRYIECDLAEGETLVDFRRRVADGQRRRWSLSAAAARARSRARA